MARPPSRSRRAPAPRPSPGPPPALLLVGAIVVVGAVVAAVAMSGKEPEPPKAPPPALRPVAKPEPEPAPKPAGPAPAKPLTPQEKDWIDSLFKEAEPHMQAFRRHAKEGWDLKGEEDNLGANAAWVKAKKEYMHAVEIVSQALEDYDKFPQDRQDQHMKSWVNRLAGWQKEWGNIPKVNVER